VLFIFGSDELDDNDDDDAVNDVVYELCIFTTSCAILHMLSWSP